MGKKREPMLEGLGVKYGVPLRKRYSRIISIQKAKRSCPSCGSLKLTRKATGIWNCARCNYTVAGGAYDL